MTQPVVKDGFFCQEMLARQDEFADSVTWMHAAFARGVEKGYDLSGFFTDPALTHFGEEVRELAEAMQNPTDPHHIKHELGDVLWWVFAVCEKQGLTLQDLTASIASRWMLRRALMETKVKAMGTTLTALPEAEIRKLWAEAKQELKAQEEAH